MVDAAVFRYAAGFRVPGPLCGVAEGRLSALRGEELRYFGQFEWQALFGHHAGHAVLVVYGERFSPVALTGENGVAQTEVDLDASQLVFLYKTLGGGYGLDHAETVERESAERVLTGGGAVHHRALFGVETFLTHVGSFDKRYDGEAEMLGKGVVAGVVGRNGHNGACAVAGQNVVAHPYRNGVSGERVDGIRAGEHTGYAAVGYAFALGTLFGGFDVGCHFIAAVGCRQPVHQFAFGRQHHERYAEDGVGACGEYGECHVAVFHAELHLRAFRSAYPVALRLFERVGPVNAVKPVEQALGVGRYAETPLLHFLLYYRISSALRNAVHHFVVGQNGAQLGTPVHHRLAQIGYAVVHEHFLAFFFAHGLPLFGREAEFFGAGGVESFRSLTFEVFREVLNGLCLLAGVAVE